MALQTTVTSSPARALPGMLADSAPRDILSGIVDAASGVAPGRFAVRTAGGNFAGAHPSATFAAAAALGLVLHQHHARTPTSDSNNEVYDDESEFPFLRHGRAWCVIEDAFDAGDALFVRFATGSGGTSLGALRTDADTASAVAVTGLRVLTSGGAGDLGLVEINL